MKTTNVAALVLGAVLVQAAVVACTGSVETQAHAGSTTGTGAGGSGGSTSSGGCGCGFDGGIPQPTIYSGKCVGATLSIPVPGYTKMEIARKAHVLVTPSKPPPEYDSAGGIVYQLFGVDDGRVVVQCIGGDWSFQTVDVIMDP